MVENEFLSNPEVLGHINVSLSNNPTSAGLQNCFLEKSSLTEIAPFKLLDLRQQLFSGIKSSNDNDNGILETVNLFEFKDIIEEYIYEYESWLSDLYEKIDDSDGKDEPNGTLKMLFFFFFFLDMDKVQS